MIYTKPRHKPAPIRKPTALVRPLQRVNGARVGCRPAMRAPRGNVAMSSD
jgi:hypothetical protein